MLPGRELFVSGDKFREIQRLKKKTYWRNDTFTSFNCPSFFSSKPTRQAANSPIFQANGSLTRLVAWCCGFWNGLCQKKQLYQVFLVLLEPHDPVPAGLLGFLHLLSGFLSDKMRAPKSESKAARHHEVKQTG